MLTSWLGDAERSSGNSTDSERSEVDEAITGGLSSPTKAAVARKQKPKWWTTCAAVFVHQTGDSDLPRPLVPVPAPVPALESFVNQTVFDVHFSRANRKSHHPTSPFRACGATLKGRVQNVDCTLGRHERPPHERGRATRCGAYNMVCSALGRARPGV